MLFLNRLFILVILVIISGLVFYFFRRPKQANIQEREERTLDIPYLKEAIRNSFDKILKTNVAELNLNREETEKAVRNRRKLRNSYKNCYLGNIGDKEYIKQYIKDFLQKEYQISELNIDQILPFEEKNKLTTIEKFDILLHWNKKKYGYLALRNMIKENCWDQIRSAENGEKYYFVSESDIEQLYAEIKPDLSFLDKIEILAQRIYQEIKGHSVIDEIRDQKIDGILGGVSGVPEGFYDYDLRVSSSNNLKYSYDSVWIFFEGKSMHLSFLSFGKQKELERVCKNVYKFGHPGQLSANKGAMVNEMADGARVVVARPNLSDSWVFIIRKADNVLVKDIKDVIPDPGNEIAIATLKYIVKGCQVTAITGMQGSGKTTLLKTLIQFINAMYSLRVQELNFELWLRKVFPNRNIITFRETDGVSGEAALNLSKKTDGAVNILGEVVEDPVVLWLIKISQVGTLFTMFTNHAKKTKKLIDNFRNVLLSMGGYSSERAAEQQVVDAIRFDVHMEMSVTGQRYIERITEIVPISSKEGATYQLKNIVEFRDGEYVLTNQISEETQSEMKKFLFPDEIQEFDQLMKGGAA